MPSVSQEPRAGTERACPCHSRSTLLILVSAFAGRSRILHAYQEAVQQGYRFYSFGGDMLVL